MHYIVQSGGKQYIVKKGDIINVEKIDGDTNATIELEVVSTLDDKKGFESKTTSLEAKILDQFRDDKIRVFKYKRRKRYRKSYGHRQYLTKLEVC